MKKQLLILALLFVGIAAHAAFPGGWPTNNTIWPTNGIVDIAQPGNTNTPFRVTRYSTLETWLEGFFPTFAGIATSNGVLVGFINSSSNSLISTINSSSNSLVGTINSSSNSLVGTINSSSNSLVGTINSSSNSLIGTINSSSNVLRGAINTKVDTNNGTAFGLTTAGGWIRWGTRTLGTITLTAGNRFTIGTNDSFEFTFSGTAVHGQVAVLSVSNFNVTTRINGTNLTGVYNPFVRSNVTTLEFESNAVTTVTFTYDTNHVSAGRWEIVAWTAPEWSLEWGANLSGSTNGMTQVVRIGVQNAVTNITFDASAADNVLKMKGYLWLKGPDRVQNGGMLPNTNDVTAVNFNKIRFSNSADEASNYAEWDYMVPDDIDTSVDLRAKLIIRLTGADTGTHRYVISMDDVADSAAFAGSVGNAINMDFAGDGGGGSGDVETVAYVTLTNWRSNMTAGRHLVIRVARDGNATQDASTVDSDLSLGAIEYGISQ